MIAVDLLLTSHDTEAQAARSAPPQDNVFAAVEMPARAKKEIKNTKLSTASLNDIYCISILSMCAAATQQIAETSNQQMPGSLNEGVSFSPRKF